EPRRVDPRLHARHVVGLEELGPDAERPLDGERRLELRAHGWRDADQRAAAHVARLAADHVAETLKDAERAQDHRARLGRRVELADDPDRVPGAPGGDHRRSLAGADEVDAVALTDRAGRHSVTSKPMDRALARSYASVAAARSSSANPTDLKSVTWSGRSRPCREPATSSASSATTCWSVIAPSPSGIRRSPASASAAG